MFVCFRLGAVWVPTNFRQTAEIAYLGEASGASAMICASDFPIMRALQEQGLNLRRRSIGSSNFGDDYDALVRRL